MPGNWMAIEINFPTFTGGESAEEQVDALLNYITLLVEQLRYSLNNLDASNFNAAALDGIKDSTTAALYEKLVATEAQLAALRTSVQGLSGRVATEEAQLGALQTSVQGLSGHVGTLGEDVQAVGDGLSGLTQSQAALQQRLTDVEALLGGFAVDSGGNPAIGASGKRTDITGDVYINGVLVYEESGGGEQE